MPWGKLDDKHHRNRKIRELRRTRSGRVAHSDWLYYWSWCLDDPNLDGRIPETELSKSEKKSAQLLVEVGLWEESDGGYMMHDWADYNPTKQGLEQARDKSRRTSKAYRDKQRDESPAGHAVFDESNGDPSRIPPVPIPSPIPIPDPPSPPPEPVSRALIWQSVIRIWCDVCGVDSSTVSPARWEREARDILRACGGDERALRRVLEHWMADPWVAENRPPLSHLAKHWPKYVEALAPAAAPVDREALDREWNSLKGRINAIKSAIVTEDDEETLAKMSDQLRRMQGRVQEIRGVLE